MRDILALTDPMPLQLGRVVHRLPSAYAACSSSYAFASSSFTRKARTAARAHAWRSSFVSSMGSSFAHASLSTPLN
jgi:hypothetical protein